ncbi:Nitrate reductase [Metarhizium brunneum]|uniref:Nitrate reductase [NADPH] n=1 Tax=Metarhizium brunneum TaxID=500148 RepID=A0A7D5V6B6_9HYPO|nr:Nitrate reductase [Metarhizium brunneum]
MDTSCWKVKVQPHPGSSVHDIATEPNWGVGHEHRVGYRNSSNRLPGLTDDGDYHAEIEQAQLARKELEEEITHGTLINFRQLIEHQPDFHLRHPENKSQGWRYVLDTTEDWVKQKQDWPINIRRKQEEQKSAAKNDKEKKERRAQQEHEWRRDSDTEKHNDAYAVKNASSDKEKRLEDMYSMHEIALLRGLEHENDYVSHLKENDGKGNAPKVPNQTQISIDEQDQFSPDNWLPRSSHLIRNTGKHPLNAEPDLSQLFSSGLITPNELHYVRNHGGVPRLLWEFHQLKVEYNSTTKIYSMEDIKGFDVINIPIALACDGNRRKELNMMKRSKGFDWGPGGVSCSYWKGPLLRDVLVDAGVPELPPDLGGKRYWVNFEGADELSEGNYATSIPFEYAMCAQNDILLAYEMNDVPLPPDHGYPIRVIIPGYVGGRCVKWLRKIWISQEENKSHYHIWDNRVLPAFISEMDGPFAEALFRHPDTACNEQNLNSIIAKPAHGETISLSQARKGSSYRIAGIAYDGGGHEVQRVEVSLDNGKTWLYCIRRFPEAPIRHGNKYWAWVHWHVDVDVVQLLRASSITARCFNVFKNTQPRDPNWNIMGMMNNCWYTVKLEIVNREQSAVPYMLFRHPTEPGKGEGGWMKPSTENRISDTRQEARAPQKQFTREEIEKHDKQHDCWIVVDGKVYDATSVLGWHPGGPAAILEHAGKVHQDTTDEFSSIHDDFAIQKLQECVLGVVTEKTANFIKKNAEAAAKETAYTPTRPLLPALSDTNPPRDPYRDGDGTFDLTVKTYFADENQPGGAMSSILDCIPLGEEVEIRGPTGEIVYNGDGNFIIDGKECHFSRVSLVLGGSGVTPGYALVARVIMTPQDKTTISLIDANKTEDDILMRDELDQFRRESRDKLRVTHILSHPSDSWNGLRGHVDEVKIKDNLFPPSDDSVAFLCGPPTMIQKAVLPVLKEWGYIEDENVFGF